MLSKTIIMCFTGQLSEKYGNKYPLTACLKYTVYLFMLSKLVATSYDSENLSCLPKSTHAYIRIATL